MTSFTQTLFGEQDYGTHGIRQLIVCLFPTIKLFVHSPMASLDNGFGFIKVE